MGYALARAAVKAGYKVTLITAPTNLRPPVGVKVVSVETSAQMFAAVRKYFDKCDCLIMTAAVSDYAPVKTSKIKIKKSSHPLAIKLKPTDDILKWAGKNKGKSRKEKVKREKQIVVGFALEDKDLQRSAEEKRKEKNLDMIIANTPTAIGSEKSTVHIKTADKKWIKIGPARKDLIAGRIVTMANDIYFG